MRVSDTNHPAFTLGRKDYMRGRTYDSCPYAYGLARCCWLAGWDRAEELDSQRNLPMMPQQ